MKTRLSYILKVISSFIISVISFFIIIDSNLFIYSSLSNSLIFSLLTSVLTIIVAGFHIIKNREISYIYLHELILIIWGIYIVVHTFLIKGEYYRTNYFITGLLYLMTLSYLIKRKIIDIKFIKTILLCIGVVELIFMSGQLLGMIESGNKYFTITGIGENPNTNAIFLLCCIPLLIEKIRIGAHKLFYYFFLMLIIAFLIVLKCRTAYVGGLSMLLVYMFSSKLIHLAWERISKLKKIILITGIGIGITGISVIAYQIKKDSADGRLFIWKLAKKMVVQKPFTGYGYGLFERNYNITQADFFEKEVFTQTECRNASHVAMAYNDYLEQIIEGGILGGIFYFGFLISLICVTVRQHDHDMCAIVTAITVMAFFNFIYTAIPVWFMLLNCGAILFSAEYKRLSISRLSGFLFSYVPFFVIIGLFYYTWGMCKAQIRLRESISLMKDKKHKEALSILSPVLDKAKTSEAFLIHYADLLMMQKKYDEALRYYKEASLYTSSSRLYFHMSECYRHLSKKEEALKCLKFISSKIPTNLRSRYQILCLQIQIDNKDAARQTALEIVKLKPKIVNNKSIEYKNRAQRFLESVEQ